MAYTAVEFVLYQYLADTQLGRAKFWHDRGVQGSGMFLPWLVSNFRSSFQGGLSTAGGSVTLGLIADLYEPEVQHWPLCFIVLSSTIGTSIGGVIGGPIERCQYYDALYHLIHRS